MEKKEGAVVIVVVGGGNGFSKGQWAELVDWSERGGQIFI